MDYNRDLTSGLVADDLFYVSNEKRRIILPMLFESRVWFDAEMVGRGVNKGQQGTISLAVSRFGHIDLPFFPKDSCSALFQKYRASSPVQIRKFF